MGFHNPGYFLKPGMFATVHLTAELAADAVLVPDTAVLRSGKPGKCPKCGMTLIPVMKSPAAPAAQPEAAAPMLYTCPMAEDADVVTDHPGACPKCGMKLVATGAVAHGAQAAEAWRQTHPRER